MTPSPVESLRHSAAVCQSEAAVRAATQPDFARLLTDMAARFTQRASEADKGTQPDLFARH